MSDISKIPVSRVDGLSTDLAGKQDKLTAGTNITIDENNVISATGGSVPDNVYTQDNLVGGNGIIINKVDNPDIITEDTVALFHFNENYNNAIENSPFSFSNESISTGWVFGNDAKPGFGEASPDGTKYLLLNQNLSYVSLTIDFWVKQDTLWGQLFGLLPDSRILYGEYGSHILVRDTREDTLISIPITQDGGWHHIALVYTSTSLKAFCDGVYINEISRSGNVVWNSGTTRGDRGSIDELRITKAAVWTTDFTPPSEPYGTGYDIYQINSTTTTFTGTDGSNAGTSGLVPAPAVTDVNKYLKSDGTWSSVSGGGVATPTYVWYKNNVGNAITIADTSSANLVLVYKNGVLLDATGDYTISGTTLTLVSPLVTTDKITLGIF